MEKALFREIDQGHALQKGGGPQARFWLEWSISELDREIRGQPGSSTLECDNSQVPASTPPRSAVLRRSFRKDFPAAVRGEGVYLWDAANKKYLDFSGSAAVNFIGHGVQKISAAMAAQAAKLEFVHTSQFTTPIAEEYAQELLAFAGENFRGGAVYFTSGGSESIETALKLARQYQVEIGESRRYQILSRKQSYHGPTLGALSVSGNRRRPAIRRRTRPRHRSGHRRSRRLHLRAAERCHAGRSRPSAGILAIRSRNLPPTRRTPHRRRSHDRHGPHRPQLRRRALAGPKQAWSKQAWSKQEREQRKREK